MNAAIVQHEIRHRRVETAANNVNERRPTADEIIHHVHWSQFLMLTESPIIASGYINLFRVDGISCASVSLQRNSLVILIKCELNDTSK